MLLQTNFEQDPSTQGWMATPDEEEGVPEWVSGEGHSGSHYLKISRGRWESPDFPVTPGAWYRLSFWYRGLGGEYATLFQWDGEENFIAADRYENVPAAEEWTQKVIHFRGQFEAVTGKVLFGAGWGETPHELHVDEVELQEVTIPEALAAMDERAAGLPPLTWTPPEGRHGRIPLTMKRLRSGERVRVVMLGDSIINDTSSGPWEILVERLYPGAKIDLQVSVRGGTGCWHYQDPEQLEAYVLRYAPQLLWIGGISQKGDIEAIRSVIQQTRAALPETEILLSTNSCGPFGDPRSNPEWSSRVDPDGDNWRSLLWRLAEEEGAEWLDMSAGWGTYIKSQDKPYEYYMRDPVHANDHGRLVLAKVIETYFKS
ncbi:MAG: hypothetical protein GX100_03875 [candidate division WS1 bacterium]|nr:hypothetical protein [candidate division WS1 bacterium]